MQYPGALDTLFQANLDAERRLNAELLQLQAERQFLLDAAQAYAPPGKQLGFDMASGRWVASPVSQTEEQLPC